MRIITLFLITIFVSNKSFGQQGKNELVEAYKANSNEKLQAFIKTWVKETSFEDMHNLAPLNDTASNIYGIINAFYNPAHPMTKCILMQETIPYRIVDNLDEDTIFKRAIYIIYRKRNADSVYAKALLEPQKYANLASDNALDCYELLKSGSIKISTVRLIFKDKKVLPLTKKYQPLLENYLLNNSPDQRDEINKRLIFLKDELQFPTGMGGYIRIQNAPARISVVVDSTYQKAFIYSSGDYSGWKSVLKKVDGQWIVIKSTMTWIE